MRFGCCSNMATAAPGTVGEELFETAAAVGYDYIELPLSPLAFLTDGAFASVKRHLLACGIGCEACNDFVPPQIRVTGEDADQNRLLEYFRRALARAGELGVRTVVFGSGGAKSVPAGFSMQTAHAQLVEATAAAGRIAAQYGIVIAIEPIRAPDCNIVNLFREGVQLARDVAMENVLVLADSYHMACMRESPLVVAENGRYLAHIHFSSPNFPLVGGVPSADAVCDQTEAEMARRGGGRVYPAPDDGWDHSAFIHAVKAAGYDGRVSVEARTAAFREDAARALRFLKQAFSDRDGTAR